MIVLLLLSDAYTLAVVMQCAVWNRDVLAVVLTACFMLVCTLHTHTHTERHLSFHRTITNHLHLATSCV